MKMDRSKDRSPPRVAAPQRDVEMSHLFVEQFVERVAQTLETFLQRLQTAADADAEVIRHFEIFSGYYGGVVFGA
jgi:hypothetical protein